MSVLDRFTAFGAELKRRRVPHAMGLYLVGAWVTIEVTATVFPLLLLPEWTSRAVVIAAVLGLPIVIVMAWAFDMTRQGLQRTVPEAGGTVSLGVRVAVVLLTVAATGAAGWGARGVWFGPAADAATARTALDPTRVAVLYLDDFSPNGELGYLADGLTEALIHELAQIDVLEVVSRNGVKPYRDLSISLDSLAQLLRVGTLVEGSVEGRGRTLGATIQLIDARTGGHLLSQRFSLPDGDGLMLRDSIVAEVARTLGRTLGRRLDLERRRGEAGNADAWDRVQRARSLIDEADRLRWGLGAEDAAEAALERADSLLAVAGESDPTWADPFLMRARVARLLAGVDVAMRQADDEARLRSGLRFADAALERVPGNAEALALKGQILVDLTWLYPDSTESLARRAESQLRAAVTADTGNAIGWVSLADLLRSRGEFAEAAIAAERALAADPFLIHAEKEILFTLGHIWLELEQLDRALRWVKEGRRRFPAEPGFAAVQLVIVAGGEGPTPDPDSAWALVHEVEEGYQLDRWSHGWLQSAAVLARNGRADSARAVIARVRGDGSDDPWLDYYEANVRIQLGERDRALDLLDNFLARYPSRRAYIGRDWWWRPLRDTDRFRAMVEAGVTADG
jgi:TolB-like protein